MIEVAFPANVQDELIRFAVIIAHSDGKWVFCKHRERTTLEVPGGHREAGESLNEVARRELVEETGAAEFTITPICVYSVSGSTPINLAAGCSTSYGMLYAARITAFSELKSEIESIHLLDELPDNWTYPLIQPRLIEEALRRNALPL